MGTRAGERLSYWVIRVKVTVLPRDPKFANVPWRGRSLLAASTSSVISTSLTKRIHPLCRDVHEVPFVRGVYLHALFLLMSSHSEFSNQVRPRSSAEMPT